MIYLQKFLIYLLKISIKNIEHKNCNIIISNFMNLKNMFIL
jgi:hypothetical protein